MSSLQNVHVDLLTNEVILDIFTYIQETRTASWQEIKDIFSHMYGRDLAQTPEQTFRSSFEKVKRERTRLMNNRRTRDDLSSYLNKPWILQIFKKRKQTEKTCNVEDCTSAKSPKFINFEKDVIQETHSKLVHGW